LTLTAVIVTLPMRFGPYVAPQHSPAALESAQPSRARRGRCCFSWRYAPKLTGFEATPSDIIFKRVPRNFNRE